ncbi:centrosomal protein of 128 kDa [Bombina bombina]|uniref:centrosomal protein of 128 kDa n=1 Tax=Bombina bombina TaxID=8345 RepID=UPI00235B1881|nr:centrosomal protein of 128 kDa [Bombina bombina]
MAESSSDSDSFHRTHASRRGPLRADHTRARGAGEVREKIHSLANTLQDTSRNLKQVDDMLGQYREYNNEQTDAISTLKETLEQSIDQLRSQRLSRLSGMRSASLSSLCASDLEAGAAAPVGRNLQPTSPLRDYMDLSANRRRRSRSASVRFVDEAGPSDQLHTMHQSLRDLSSDQLRLNDDLQREYSRRNRTDVETKKALEELNARLSETKRQESVSDRVERRLQELEKEMRNERQQVERRQDHLSQVSVQLQEALKNREAKVEVVEASLKDQLGKSEIEKSQLGAELERCRRKLDQTEGSRETLLCQIEDLRSQLLKAEEERSHLHHQVTQMSRHSFHDSREEEKKLTSVVERSEREKLELERQISELRSQLSRSAILSEVEDLKRCLDQKDREKGQLTAHIEALTSDMEKRERLQLRMLEQLKDIQSRYETCERERRLVEEQASEMGQQLEEAGRESEQYVVELRQAEVMRLEVEKKKEELKTRAQEAVKRLRLRCKKLERDLEKKEENISEITDQNVQVTKEKEETKSQLQSMLQQAENLRRELSEILAKRALQEEELHLREVRLSEAHEQRMELERELRESQETIVRLEGELQRYRELQHQLQEDQERLQEELGSLGRAYEKSKEKMLELQEAVKDLSAERAELNSRLAQEEKSGKELRRSLCEAEKQAEFAREELTSAGRQLKNERDVHQRELSDLRSTIQSAKSKHERSIQEMLTHFRQEREELENHILRLKAELMDHKSLVKSERQRVEKIKVECDKLSDDVSRSKEENATLRCKYHLAVEEKEQQANTSEQRMSKLEDTNQELKEQLSSLETERETILCAIELEINTACQLLSSDSTEKFKALSTSSHLKSDPHYWLAETKTKLQWLREEVKERDGRERKVRRQLQQSREQLKEQKLSKDSERESLYQQIVNLEQQLEEAQREKKSLLERTCKRDEEMWLLQDRIMELERSTRMALEHLESVPEKLSLLDDMKDLTDSNQQRKQIEERYAQYREIVGSLQQQLEDSKRRIQEYREEKTKADAHSVRLTALSTSLRGNSFLSSSLRSDCSCPAAPLKKGRSLQFDGLEESTFSVSLNGSVS